MLLGKNSPKDGNCNLLIVVDVVDMMCQGFFAHMRFERSSYVCLHDRSLGYLIVIDNSLSFGVKFPSIFLGVNKL